MSHVSSGSLVAANAEEASIFGQRARKWRQCTTRSRSRGDIAYLPARHKSRRFLALSFVLYVQKTAILLVVLAEFSCQVNFSHGAPSQSCTGAETCSAAHHRGDSTRFPPPCCPVEPVQHPLRGMPSSLLPAPPVPFCVPANQNAAITPVDTRAHARVPDRFAAAPPVIDLATHLAATPGENKQTHAQPGRAEALGQWKHSHPNFHGWRIEVCS